MDAQSLETMTAMTAPPFGAADAMAFVDLPAPVAGAGELRVRVTAIGINRVDIMQRSGSYPPPPGASPVLGVEFAGEVDSVGTAAGDYRPGDRVFGLVASGAYAERLVVDHRHVVPTPADWDDTKAASVIETFCTAHETLFELGRLAAGERVLIHAAGSAVGTAAVQMARHAGATVIGTAGADAKIAGARQLGAEHVINYKTTEFADAVLELFPDGIDLVEDFVGSSYFQRHLKILRRRGRIVQVGLLAAGPAEIDTAPILSKRLVVRGFTLRPQNAEEKAGIVERFRRHWMPRLEDGTVKPVIHAVLGYADLREAHRIIEANENFGKVIVTVP